MHGELLVVTGPPGAGKSTVAALLAERRSPSALVEGDEFFRFLRAGRIDPWLVESDRQNSVVTDAAGCATGRIVHGGYWTVYDGIVGPRFVAQFLASTGLDGLHYAVLLPPVETCLTRVLTRTGHAFTDEVATRHMHAQFEQAQVGGCHVIRDPTDPVALADSILRLVERSQIWIAG